MLHRQGHPAKVAHARGNGRAGGMASASPLPSPPLSPLPAAAPTFNGTAWVELFPELNYDLTVLWTLLCGFLVVFMQCGFAVSWAGGQAGGRAGCAARPLSLRFWGAQAGDPPHGMRARPGTVWLGTCLAQLRQVLARRAGGAASHGPGVASPSAGHIICLLASPDHTVPDHPPPAAVAGERGGAAQERQKQ